MGCSRDGQVGAEQCNCAAQDLSWVAARILGARQLSQCRAGSLACRMHDLRATFQLYKDPLTQSGGELGLTSYAQAISLDVKT